jgi:hypothetical protein
MLSLSLQCTKTLQHKKNRPIKNLSRDCMDLIRRREIFLGMKGHDKKLTIITSIVK